MMPKDSNDPGQPSGAVPALPSEPGPSPCENCGNEERTAAGYLACECPDGPQRLSARWHELFWALPSGPMRSKLRSLEIDTGQRLRDLTAALAAATQERDRYENAQCITCARHLDEESAAEVQVQALRALVEKWRGSAVVKGGNVTCVNHVFYHCADELDQILSSPTR